MSLGRQEAQGQEWTLLPRSLATCALHARLQGSLSEGGAGGVAVFTWVRDLGGIPSLGSTFSSVQEGKACTPHRAAIKLEAMCTDTH